MLVVHDPPPDPFGDLRDEAVPDDPQSLQFVGKPSSHSLNVGWWHQP
jgi:hypothetical protein